MLEMRSKSTSSQHAPGRNLGWLVVVRGNGPLWRGRIIDLPADKDSFVIERDDRSAGQRPRDGKLWTWRAVVTWSEEDNQFRLTVPASQEPLGATFLEGSGSREPLRIGEEPVLLQDGALIRMGRTAFAFKALYSM